MPVLLSGTCIILLMWGGVFWWANVPRTYWRGVNSDKPEVTNEEALRDEAKKARRQSTWRLVRWAFLITALFYGAIFLLEPAKKVQAALWPTSTPTASLTLTASITPTLKPTLSFTLTPWETHTPTLAPMTPTARVIYQSQSVPVTVVVVQTRVVVVIQTVIVEVTPTFTPTPAPSDTPTQTYTPSPTSSPTPTFTETQTPTPTETP